MDTNTKNLTGKNQPEEKKLFDTAKMESLVHENQVLLGIYQKLIEDQGVTWGFHYNENILAFMFHTYVLNDPKYFAKYKMAIPKKKKRRDKSGINQLDKELQSKRNMHIKLDTEKKEASETKPIETENENKIEEMTGSGSSGSYSGPSAWAVDGKPHQRLNIPGSITVQMNENSNYLTDPSLFKEYFNSLNEAEIGKSYEDMHVKSNSGLGVSMPTKDVYSKDKIADISKNSMLFIDQDLTKLGKDDVNIIHNDMTTKNSYFPHPDNKNLKNDGIVQTNTQHPTLKEQSETEGKKETFITDHSDEFGREIKNMPKSDVKIIYKDMETHTYDKPDLKTEAIDISKKAVQAAKAIKPSDTKDVSSTTPPKLPEKGGDETSTAAKTSTASKTATKTATKAYTQGNVTVTGGAGDGATNVTITPSETSPSYIGSKDIQADKTKTSKLPKKVSENYNDTDQYVLKSAIKKVPINDLLGWSKVNVLNSETDPKFKIETYAKAKGVDLDTLSKLADYYLNNNLSYDGTIQTTGQEILVDLIDELSDNITSNIEPEKVVDESSMIDPSENTMAMSGSNPSSMKMGAPMGTGSQSMETGTNTSDSNTTNTTTENYKVDETKMGKVNQKGYEFYLFNKKTKKLDTGWEFKQDAFDAKKEQGNPNDFAVYTKRTVMQMGLNPDDNKSWLNEPNIKNKNNNINKMEESKELEGYNVELNEFKKVMDNLQTLGEDRKPSALVMLDRLQNQNGKNFNSDFDKSASNDLVKQEDMIDDQTKKDTTVVGDKPYTGGENIEEDELKKTKGESFKNVGNSANLKGDEIPKRNMTKEEDEEVASLTGGLHTFKYDLDPGKRFEERTEEEMGENFAKKRDLYLKAHDKMNMYKKDQPVTIQKESVTGKYFDFFNKKKLINFTLNEIKEVEQSVITENINSYALINFDGIGNKYDNLCKNIDESVDNTLTNNIFYINETDNSVVYVKKSTGILNESEDKKINVNNDNFNKMKHLFNYKSESFMSTKNSKNNRGF